MPKSYVAFKWSVYALATLLLFALQSVVLNHVRALGVTPFIYPMLPALVAMYEGQEKGSIFALVLGIVCDLFFYGPFEGFFAIAFVILALLSAAVAKNLRSTGFLGGVFIAALALLLTGLMRVAVQALTGGPYIEIVAWTAAVEAAVSLPAVAAALPVYRAIHRKCAVDY